MNDRFSQATAAIPALFHKLESSKGFTVEEALRQSGIRSGIYVLFENGEPAHVGRTRNLRQRLRGHTYEAKCSGSLAIRRAKKALGLLPGYGRKGARAALETDPTFRNEYLHHVRLIRTMEVRFVEVEEAALQYLLELYAHMEYDLPLDEFETH